ncbi:MAG: PqqD family protein [Muribaculaceae bacterium]|nr:PqqD family protein [Muribaculaceae bacterium]
MKIPEHISWKSLSDKVVAVNTQTGEYYTMNLVASMMWMAINDGKDESGLIEMLSEKFPDMDKSVLSQDMKEQLEEWKNEKLIL